jgi:PAS domain S-box-containing protein
MHDLPSDEAAIERSHVLLSQHRSCSHILVCDGDREVTATMRKGASPLVDGIAVDPAPRLPDAVRKALTDETVQASGAALIATTAQGAVIYWNDAAQRLYGWKADEALGRNVVEVTPALQSREQSEAIMKRLQQGKPWEGDIVLRRRDGTPFKAFVADVPVGDAETGVIIGVSVAAANRRVIEAIRPRLTGLLLGETGQ